MPISYNLSNLEATHPSTRGLPQEMVLPLFDAFGEHIKAIYDEKRVKTNYIELGDKLFTETVNGNRFISSLELDLSDEEASKFPHLGSLPLDELKNSAREKLKLGGTHNLSGQMYNFYFGNSQSH